LIEDSFSVTRNSRSAAYICSSFCSMSISSEYQSQLLGWWMVPFVRKAAEQRGVTSCGREYQNFAP
jgi:hypothetical protein